MNRKNNTIWSICIAAVLVIVVLGYTPLMLPAGKYKPMILGIPYSLWLPFLVTVILVLLTYVGARIHPGNDSIEEE